MTEPTEDVARWMICGKPWTERCECTDRCATACRCTSQPRREGQPMIQVRVRDRASEPPWGSGPTTPLVRSITISAACPMCGGPRGEPFNVNQCDDGAHYGVNMWRNDCGHVDLYVEVLAEAAQLASSNTNNPVRRV